MFLKNENGLNVYFYSANNPKQAGVGRLFTIVKKASDVAFPPDNPEYSLYRQLANERSSVINSIKGIK
ncbi:hypothetical protein OSC52_01145 [Clostridium pasteurianum]|uniref:hypothetical protein n=1 Tax=Clostridium pasteurianum TaxID=1501 RepID=UPI0022609104|nr:hypothetical protein [Clostridium pasteurianum]UZW14479.1 hypothetical protein OSC52_01145 [Clostridium pasteurianum]